MLVVWKVALLVDNLGSHWVVLMVEPLVDTTVD